MEEILPGIHHWTAMHEGIGAPVSSYYVESAAAVIDPMVPEEGLDWFDGKPLERVVLANRHHYRHADRFAERFGVPVLANEKGMHDLEGRPAIQTFSFGDEVAPGIVAQSFEDSWPDEGVLVIDGADAIVLADGVMRYGGTCSFVPDQYLGEDPEQEKAVLRAAVRRLLDSGIDFDAVLVGHGDPIKSGGKAELEGLTQG
jgi:hypothetical protein